ncbi:MAG: efflux transporter outer membrane subunit [Gammaproteobacteria bacterium]|nr:efflux transporter outer membrane subunit [Gammaproteobacteria bacterium]
MRVFFTSIICIILSSCMVGPDFHIPCAPHVHSYTSYPLPKKTKSTPTAGQQGVAQHFVVGADIPGQWWKLFHSTQLDNLIRIGIANSPNLTAATAAVKQAIEALNVSAGNALYPNISAQLPGERQRSFNIFGGSSLLYNLYNPTFNVTYTLDVFGGARRELESLRAQIDYSNFQLEAAYLTLTSDIAAAAINIASIRGQIEATKQIIELQNNQLVIVQKQYKLGGASGNDVLTQKTQVAQTIAQLPPLQQSLEVTMDALAVLIGEFPSEARLPTFNLNSLHLPAVIPVSIPSALVRQRPDIRASEALLHSASAQVGVSTAALFPQVNLSGAYGWGSTSANGLFTYQTLVWNYMGQILQPIFNGGALRAQRRESIAAFEQAVAQYRQTVLKAFQDVADTLGALKNDAAALLALREAEDAAYKALILSQGQYNLGGVNYLILLNAQRQYQRAKIDRIKAEAARFVDTATLFKALGGGWWNREEMKA